MQFIDSHCHLDFFELQDALSEHIAQANKLGVTHFVVPGVTLAQSQQLVAFAQLYPQCKIAFGLHPYFIAHHDEASFAQLKSLAIEHQHDIAAIGECGIDGTCGDLDFQQLLFIQHIQLSNELELPLIVHHRQSHHLIAQVFKKVPPRFGGVIHAFSGSLQQAQYYIKLGFKLGVGGTISYERARKTKQVFSQLPLDSLLLETDAPSMPLSGYQGQANVPKRLVEVFDYLCELRTESPKQIATQLYSSSRALFRI